MREITLQSIPVMADGGSHEGQLVLVDGELAAVFSLVPKEEAAGGESQAGGWFLEAGFGPCGSLMTVTPPIFKDLESAIHWVRMRLSAGLDQS